jgi:hypothetical protein
MKLNMLREHYQSMDGGKSWTPKRAFESEEAIKDSGFFPNKWHSYVCNHCNSYHIASVPSQPERQ